ncbi:uncharacterized protein LOC143510068 isoform X2 [Brachyhypopomus gauderio]|uniref:uncharacterized protein LOC143510068 isoform X2 n=1 Tax=Brachyhypopomus gauderio TaxID=698409 RepID=UPI0040434F0E
MAESGEPAIYKWTDEDTRDLIRWRVANAHLFTGKRNAAVRGFEAFVLEKKLPKAISPLYVKKKWENLKQKYKLCLREAAKLLRFADTTITSLISGGDESAYSREIEKLIQALVGQCHQPLEHLGL